MEKRHIYILLSNYICTCVTIHTCVTLFYTYIPNKTVKPRAKSLFISVRKKVVRGVSMLRSRGDTVIFPQITQYSSSLFQSIPPPLSASHERFSRQRETSAFFPGEALLEVPLHSSKGLPLAAVP